MGLIVRRALFGAFGAFAVIFPSPAGTNPPSATDPNPYAVFRPESIQPFFQASRSRRVDIAIIGDSNERALLISGHEDAMASAFAERFGCYATRVDPVAGLGSWSATIFGSSCSQNTALTGGAPVELIDSSLPVEAGFPGSYAYLASGEALGPDNNLGLLLGALHPVGASGPLRWHMTHYRFPLLAQAQPFRRGVPPQPPPPLPPPGGFSPTIRAGWPGNAWANYASDHVSTTVLGSHGFTDWSLDLPPGERSPYGVLFCLTSTAEQVGINGPFYARWNRVENLDRHTGIAYSPLLQQGGQTTRDAAISLVSRATQSQMTEWFRQVTRLQNGEPMLLVQIIQGANDASFGPPAMVYQRGDAPRPQNEWLIGAPTNERIGIKQNTMSVINRLRDTWMAAGYDEDNLYFLIGCYHPHPASWQESAPGANDGPQYHVIREQAIPAWREICTENSNVAMLDGFKLSSPEEFLANGWYRFSSPFYNDHAHLSLNGYGAWGEAVVESVTRACNCGPSVDVDYDGQRGVSDVFAFLSLWFAGDPLANFDQQGATPTVPDIFAFLTAWFAGCAGH